MRQTRNCGPPVSRLPRLPHSRIWRARHSKAWCRRPAELALLGDLEIIERLSSVRGIGRWTVEMMLMFQLERRDVLPVDDFGVRNGFRLAYGLKGMPTTRALAEFGERWKPYRSVAAWYLWRAAELARDGALPTCATPPRVALVKRKAKRAAKRGRSRRASGARKAGKSAKARRK